MRLLKLSAENDRLRRLAKAHAAGEIALYDYRRMRAQVIEAVGTGREPELGDVTERRDVVHPNPASEPGRTPPRGASTGAVAAQEGRPEPVRRGFKWILVAVVLGVAVLAFARAEAALGERAPVQRFCEGADGAMRWGNPSQRP